MIDFTEFTDKDDTKKIFVECDCGNTWVLPKDAITGCIKCLRCGSKSCSE